MRLYFSVVVSVILVFGAITSAQLLLSTKDNLSMAIGIAVVILTPVLGYYIGKWVGKEYQTWISKDTSTGDKK